MLFERYVPGNESRHYTALSIRCEGRATTLDDWTVGPPQHLSIHNRSREMMAHPAFNAFFPDIDSERCGNVVLLCTVTIVLYTNSRCALKHVSYCSSCATSRQTGIQGLGRLSMAEAWSQGPMNSESGGMNRSCVERLNSTGIASRQTVSRHCDARPWLASLARQHRSLGGIRSASRTLFWSHCL